MTKENKTKDKFYELNKRLDSLVEAGMNKTKEWNTMWDESLRYFFSDQLRGKKRHKDWDWVVINYIWPAAMQEIAKLSRHHPKILVHPWSDDDIEGARVWQGGVQWQWEQRLKMRLEQIAAILDKKLFGYSVSKVYWEGQVDWDDKQKRWVGDVKHKLWHPAEFWVSPEAEKIDEAEACGTQRYVTLEWAQKKWPEFKDELEQEAEKFGEGAGGPSIRGSYSATSGTGGKDSDDSMRNRILSFILGHSKMSGERGEDTTKVVCIEEIYFKDYETISRKEEEDIPYRELEVTGQAYTEDGIIYDGGGAVIASEDWPKRTIREWDEPKYPNGRYVTRIGDIILNPDNQKYPFTRWPFVVTPHYLLPHMWQGVNAVDMYKEQQDLINVTASHLVNNMKLFGDPKIAVEQGALATHPRTKKTYKIGAGAGAIIRLVRGGLNRFRIEQPAANPAANLMLYNLFAQEFKNLTGLQSLGRGEKEPGEMSATQAQHLFISSNDRIQLQSVYEDYWVKEVASRIAEIMQANYEEERWVRIVGQEGIVGIKQITSKEKNVHFDIDIEAGATIPFDEEKRIAKYGQAYQLLAQPTVNVMLPAMLRILDIPNWKDLLEKHEPWRLWIQFLQLFEAVKKGEVDVNVAIKILTQRTMQHFKQTAQPQEVQNLTQGKK